MSGSEDLGRLIREERAIVSDGMAHTSAGFHLEIAGTGINRAAHQAFKLGLEHRRASNEALIGRAVKAALERVGVEVSDPAYHSSRRAAQAAIEIFMDLNRSETGEG